MNAESFCRLLVAVVLAFCPAVAMAQGFAGLGTNAEGFAAVAPGRDFVFTADHGAHPDFRIEWWYVTANLEDGEGRPLGIQWTLFRQALTPGPQRDGWENQQLWMGHAAVTTADAHLSDERFARGGIGQAGVAVEPLTAWIDDWRLAAADDTLSNISLRGSGEGFSYDLALTVAVAPVLQGDAGYSVKSAEGQASYYYSQPFFEAEGTVTIDGAERQVAGRAWLDREWSSQPLASDQEGWDWFSLHLPEDEKLMLFRLRQADGSAFYSGTWIAADGTTEQLEPEAITMTPLEETVVAERSMPTHWRIEIASKDLSITTAPLNPQSWMETSFAYWEGPISYAGSHEGVGYLEMTGYAPDD